MKSYREHIGGNFGIFEMLGWKLFNEIYYCKVEMKMLWKNRLCEKSHRQSNCLEGIY